MKCADVRAVGQHHRRAGRRRLHRNRCGRGARRYGRCRRAAPRTACCCARMAAATSPASMYTHRKVYAHVAKAIGCRALIVDYRRAPENVHPGPVNDMAQELQMAARSGHPAGPCRVDWRFGRRRPRRDDDPARPRAGLAVAGRDDAALALARHGSNRRDVRDERAEGPSRLPATSSRRWPGCFSAKAAIRRDPLANPLYADLSRSAADVHPDWRR